MAVDTSAAEPRAGRYATVVVIGGGCYGAYYLRQLGRAVRGGALSIDRVVVVDRDAGCRVATAAPEEARALNWRLDVADWRSWLDRSLPEQRDAVRSAIVPSPLMPHLFFEWLCDKATRRWPGASVGLAPVPAPPAAVPWQRAAPDDRYYLSYATWTCPVNCIEPARCPHTRGPRDWSLADTIDRWRGGDERRIDETVIFHCTHRAFGVGMVDVGALRAADERVAAFSPEGGRLEILVATVSHCHGALAVLRVGSDALGGGGTT
jgi:hypothetical protein